MNFSTSLFLIPALKMRLIKASYQLEADGKVHPAHTILLKTNDQTIQKDDYVVIPTGTRHGMTVGRVEEVDLLFNPDGQEQVAWAIDKVDMASHKALVEKETQAIKSIQSAEVRKRVDELSKALIADNPELAGIDFTSVTPALAAPTA